MFLSSLSNGIRKKGCFELCHGHIFNFYKMDFFPISFCKSFAVKEGFCKRIDIFFSELLELLECLELFRILGLMGLFGRLMKFLCPFSWVTGGVLAKRRKSQREDGLFLLLTRCPQIQANGLEVFLPIALSQGHWLLEYGRLPSYHFWLG